MDHHKQPATPLESDPGLDAMIVLFTPCRLRFIPDGSLISGPDRPTRLGENCYSVRTMRETDAVAQRTTNHAEKHLHALEWKLVSSDGSHETPETYVACRAPNKPYRVLSYAWGGHDGIVPYRYRNPTGPQMSIGRYMEQSNNLHLGDWMNSMAIQPDCKQNGKKPDLENSWDLLAECITAVRQLHEAPAMISWEHQDLAPKNISMPSVRSATSAAPTSFERARATSAASFYFDSMAFDNTSHTFVDGGVNFKNPVIQSCLERRPIFEPCTEALIMMSIGTGVKRKEPHDITSTQKQGNSWQDLYDSLYGDRESQEHSSGHDGILRRGWCAYEQSSSGYNRILPRSGWTAHGQPRYSQDLDKGGDNAMASLFACLSRLQKGAILLTSPCLISIINNYATHRNVAKDLPDILRHMAILMQREVAECGPPGIRLLARPSPEVFLAAAVGLTILFTKLRYLNDHPSCHFLVVSFCVGIACMYGSVVKVPLLVTALYTLPWAAFAGFLLAESLPFFLLGVGTSQSSQEEVHRANAGRSTKEEHILKF